MKEFRGQVICINVNERHLAEIDFSVVLSLKYYGEYYPFLLSLLFYISFLETVFHWELSFIMAYYVLLSFT